MTGMCDHDTSACHRSTIHDGMVAKHCAIQKGQVAQPPQTLDSSTRQLHLHGLEDVPVPRRRRTKTMHRETVQPHVDPLMDIYLERLRHRGAAPQGYKAYHYQLRVIATLAEEIAGKPITLSELFRDLSLLGRVLVDDVAPTERTQLSKWTLAQRRSAIRSFATLMRPELFAATGDDPHQILDQALQSVAERVGAGYRLTGGTPRRRGGYAPSGDDVRAVLKVVAADRGFLGLRNHAFYGILAASGSRVNALRQLEGHDCVQLPNGRLRLFLHEKGKHEPREVELSGELSSALLTYIDQFNQCAVQLAWRSRIGFDEPGPIWRRPGGGAWSYRSILKTLRTACATAGVTEFSPHAFRRAFASDAATLLPRHTVAQAGGWKGLERLDNHYIQPRDEIIWSKLRNLSSRRPTSELTRVEADAPIVPV